MGSQRPDDTETDGLASLMARAQAGDGLAYRQVLGACARLAAPVIRRVGVPAAQVEDVVQETLLTVHRARATYDPARPFEPWLRAIAQRRAVDARRRFGRSGAHEVADEAAVLGFAAPEPVAGAGVERAESSVALREAVGALPPGQRQAVELLGLGERSLAEASAMTGRSKVALKVNLHRAIAALRARMTREDR